MSCIIALKEFVSLAMVAMETRKRRFLVITETVAENTFHQKMNIIDSNFRYEIELIV